MTTTDLESTLEWMGAAHWAAPPEDATSEALAVFAADAPVPVASTRARRLEPADVRAASTMIDGDRRLIGHSGDDVDVSLLVEHPAEGRRLLAIEGRVWLARDAARAIDVVWAHDDHVLAHRRVADGDVFTFEGAPVPGWTLEIHVEGAPPVVVEDPGA